MFQISIKALAIAMFWVATAPLFSQDLTVAAAADLHPALDEIASLFTVKSGAHLKITYGSSGSFYQQIQNGAPFDAFLSANVDYPKKLEAANLATAGTYYEYARGKIVLLIRADSKLQLEKGLPVLVNPAVKTIAIADPKHAPYGVAAVAALKTENLYKNVSGKIVTAENISQAAAFVLSGAADAGIIAISLVLAPQNKSAVRYVKIPDRDYPPIQQACIVLRSSKNQKLALQFESFLHDDAAKAVFKRYGFEVSEGSSLNQSSH